MSSALVLLSGCCCVQSPVDRIGETRKSASSKLLAPASRVTESSARPRGLVALCELSDLSIYSLYQRQGCLKTTSVNGCAAAWIIEPRTSILRAASRKVISDRVSCYVKLYQRTVATRGLEVSTGWQAVLFRGRTLDSEMPMWGSYRDPPVC